jgi:hypothetical protein
VTSSRIVIEREVLARLLNAPSAALLERWVRGLRILGVRKETFSGDLGRAFGAIVALVESGTAVTIDVIVRESRGRLNADDLSWVAIAYKSDADLKALADALLNTDYRSKAASVGAVLQNAAADPKADIYRAIAIAVAELRRLRRVA